MLRLQMALLPILATVFNVAYFTLGLLGEGRIKPNTVRFGLMYAATIAPAMKGDIEPFMLVAMQPPV